MNRPLTDEEITKKFSIPPDHPRFEAAKAIALSRIDRAIFDLPMVTCPYCTTEFQKDEYFNVTAGDEWECPHCERTIYIEFVDHITQVTITTEKTT